MAQGGPAFSAGPVIASVRGGSPLGIRVGGIEGGRSISISPAEARITNIFGPAITRSDQIGFNPRPGFESVRPLTPLNIPFPIRGELKARPQVSPRVESEAATVVLLKARPEVRPGQRLVEQVFAGRLITRLTVPGVRTGAVTSTETSIASRPQAQPGAGPETSVKTVVGTAPKPEAKSRKPIINRVRIGAGNHNPDNRTAREEERRRRYIGQDLKTNSLRLEALTSKFEQLNGSGFQDVVKGAVLARVSEIGNASSFRSRLLEQRGYNGDDGSQWRIELELTATANVGRGQLEELVEANSAVEATDKPPLKLATEDEVIKVLTPPNSPVTHKEPVIVEEVIEKLVVIPEAVEASDSIQTMLARKTVTVEDIKATVRETEEIQPAPLDNLMHNNIVTIRRQLVLGRVH